MLYQEHSQTMPAREQDMAFPILGFLYPCFVYSKKLKLGLSAAQHSFYSCSFVSGEIIFRNIILKILWHKFSMVYTVLKLFCCFILTNVINRNTIPAHLNLSSNIKSPTFIWVWWLQKIAYQLYSWKIRLVETDLAVCWTY